MNEQPSYAQGRARLIAPPKAPPERDDGARARAATGDDPLVEWLVWEWSRATDNRLDMMAADTFDLADRVHYLNILVLTTFLALVVAASIALAAVLL